MPVPVQESAYLEKECRHLHSCFFKRDAPETLVQEYVRAHAELAALRDIPAEEEMTLRTILDKGLNAAAIEPWLRRKGHRHALTRKLMLIAYLAECGGGHEEFLREPRGRLAGWTGMLLAGVKGAGALAAGYAEKTFYGLV
ncbi:MAG: hypothetical protein K2N07_02025 [Desulfovibrio sp.]|nr:hypothetical protein [Desulfovibrio sp.]